MCRELTPEEYSLAVEQLLIFEVVGLVSLSEGVESHLPHLLYSCGYLLAAEGVALPQLVLILAHSVDECRLAVEEKSVVARGVLARPCQGAYSKRCGYLVGGFATALYHACKIIEIWRIGAPQYRIVYSCALSHSLCLARLQRQFLAQAEHLFAAGKRQLVDILHLGGGAAVVFHLSLHKHAVGTVVVPDVNAKRLNAHLIGLGDVHRTEKSQRLRALAESVFARTASAHPRRHHVHCWVLGYYLYCVGAVGELVGHVGGHRRASHQRAVALFAVDDYGGVAACALKGEEVALALNRLVQCEALGVGGGAVQVAVAQLSRSIVVVPVVRQAHCARFAAHGGLPLVHEVYPCASAFFLGLWKSYAALAHGHARGNGYAALLGVVHCAVKVIHHSVVLQHIALVGKHLVVGLCGVDKVVALPLLPVHEVAAHREGVEGVVGSRGVERREPEHHIKVAHLHYLRVAGDYSLHLVGEHGIALVACPFLEVVAQGDAYALRLHVVGGIYSTGIVEHHEALAQRLGVVLVYGAFVLNQLLPPLAVLVVDAHQRTVVAVPLVGVVHSVLSPRHAYVQRCTHSLVACALAADVCHPVAALILLHPVASAPVPVYQRWKSSALVHVPAAVLIRQQPAESFPLQQVVAFGEPCLVTASVESRLAVVHHVGHIPLVSLAIHRGAVNLVIVILRCHHHAVLVWRFHLLVDFRHLLLRYHRCCCGLHCFCVCRRCCHHSGQHYSNAFHNCGYFVRCVFYFHLSVMF